MDFSTLSDEQLLANLRSLQGSSTVGARSGFAATAALDQELQIHQVELEVQNRCLRETQAELEAALRRYTDLYDHLPIGYITLNTRGRILGANLTAASWLRRDRAKLTGCYMSWFLNAFDAGRFAGHLESCLAAAAEQRLEVTLHVDGGLLLEVQLTSRRAVESPGSDPVIHTAITEISKFQQARTAIEDVQREQETISTAVATDARAPFATISTLAQKILREQRDGISEPVRNLVDRIECAAIRAEQTVQQLLEYCCLGRDDVPLDPVNLEELIQQVMVELRVMIQRRHAEVVVERPLPCVRGARLVLGEVIASVITSVLRRAPSHRAPRVRISAARNQDDVVLCLADESVTLGTPEATQCFRLFERSRENFAFASGVGLAIIRRAIERMNGTVSIDASPGKPLCVNIGLPTV